MMWSVGKEVVRKHQESHSTSSVNVNEIGSVLIMMMTTMKKILNFSLALFPNVSNFPSFTSFLSIVYTIEENLNSIFD